MAIDCSLVGVSVNVPTVVWQRFSFPWWVVVMSLTPHGSDYSFSIKMATSGCQYGCL